MPAILERLARQLRSKGVKNSRAVATSQLQKHGVLKTGTNQLTTHGKTRNAMTAGERAKDRQAKYSGKHKPSDYKYNPKTNRAKLKNKSKT
jgi:hypothetical protein